MSLKIGLFDHFFKTFNCCCHSEWLILNFGQQDRKIRRMETSRLGFYVLRILKIKVVTPTFTGLHIYYYVFAILLQKCIEKIINNKPFCRNTWNQLIGSLLCFISEDFSFIGKCGSLIRSFVIISLHEFMTNDEWFCFSTIINCWHKPLPMRFAL